MAGAKKGLTYRDSGVDIEEANAFVHAIQGMIASTRVPGVVRRDRAFGGLFALDTSKYRHPIMVSSTDGVGTKLLVAKALKRHNTVGIDLVAMNVNDILCVGAKPLFFLDYVACGKVHRGVLKDVMQGITDGCRQSGAALVGGETAEMPGMYAVDDYDLAGFTVGVVEKDRMIDGSAIRAGDAVIGLASSGLHSNGFSLVRRVFSLEEQKTLGDVLLAPTRIYVKDVLALLAKVDVAGLAHVTGGAFYEKMTKILPKGKCFLIDRRTWTVPDIFKRIQHQGAVSDAEMFRTFNMGIGMVVVVRPEHVAAARRLLTRRGVSHFVIGEVGKSAAEKIRFVA